MINSVNRLIFLKIFPEVKIITYFYVYIDVNINFPRLFIIEYDFVKVIREKMI